MNQTMDHVVSIPLSSSPRQSSDQTLSLRESKLAAAVWIDFNFNFSQNSTQSFIWIQMMAAAGCWVWFQVWLQARNENTKMFLK